jgi:hypothetical protein
MPRNNALASGLLSRNDMRPGEILFSCNCTINLVIYKCFTGVVKKRSDHRKFFGDNPLCRRPDWAHIFWKAVWNAFYCFVSTIQYRFDIITTGFIKYYWHWRVPEIEES